MNAMHDLRERLRLSQKARDDLASACGDYDVRDAVFETVKTWGAAFGNRMQGKPQTRTSWDEAIRLLAGLSHRLQAENRAAQTAFIRGGEFLYLSALVPGTQSRILTVLVYWDAPTSCLRVESNVGGAWR